MIYDGMIDQKYRMHLLDNRNNVLAEFIDDAG